MNQIEILIKIPELTTNDIRLLVPAEKLENLKTNNFSVFVNFDKKSLVDDMTNLTSRC